MQPQVLVPEFEIEARNAAERPSKQGEVLSLSLSVPRTLTHPSLSLSLPLFAPSFYEAARALEECDPLFKPVFASKPAKVTSVSMY